VPAFQLCFRMTILMRRFHFALSSLVLVLAAQPLVAATYYVGICKSGAFATISAAVAGVPAGSTIFLCPGTYAEQFTISKALTLRGITYNNSTQAIIAVPSSGLTTTSSLFFGTLAAQVEVTTGPVNITGITVDGTASSSNCPSANTPYVAIFYSSGSSGTVNEVEARYQNCNNLGLGILAENGAGASQSVTIEKSNIHNDTGSGITAYSDQTPSTLTALIKSNDVASGAMGIGGEGIDVEGTAGSVSDNNVAGYNVGVLASSSSSPISGNTVSGGTDGIGVDAATIVSGNTVSNAAYGVYVFTPGAGSSVTSNHILNSLTDGISLVAGDATIKNNVIVQPSSGIGIEFNCNTDTVSGNTINGATTGMDFVPAAFTGVNTFYNVHTVRTGGC